MSALGYGLSLRQLYYQFVSRDWLDNLPRVYDNFGSLISLARRAGLVDWNAIEDRSRNRHTYNQWGNPTEILRAVAEQYAVNLWEGQKYRVEAWVEKQALEDVLIQACEPYQVPVFACKGYASDSELYAAARRFRWYIQNDITPVVFYMGDHDPSGLDMSRDIPARLELFSGGLSIEVNRLALNMAQVEEYSPPPNPAKETDSRAKWYIEEYGDESFELDALPPQTLAALIDSELQEYIDGRQWGKREALQEADKAKLAAVASRWSELTKGL